MKLISIVSSMTLLVLLASCGGGSDDPAPAASATTPATTPTTPAPAPTETALKYAGTWVGCFPNGAASSRETLVITQLTPAVLSATSTETNYAAASCAGAAGTTKTNPSTFTVDGSKTIGTDTVDKVTITQPGRPAQKQVVLAKGTAPVMLFVGKQAADGGAVDAEGYPTTLEPLGFTKQ